MLGSALSAWRGSWVVRFARAQVTRTPDATLMGTSEINENWLRTYLEPRFPELVEPYCNACRAYERMRQADSISPADLKTLVEAASSSRGPLYEQATTFLARLTAQHSEAREAVKQMLHDSQWHVRFNAILSVCSSTPRDFAVQVVREALNDRSARVREKAADWALRLEMREVVPDLEEQAKLESGKAIGEIRLSLALLRDGYLLEHDETGYSLTIPIANGISGHRVSRADLERKGIERVIAEIRRQDPQRKKESGRLSWL